MTRKLRICKFPDGPNYRFRENGRYKISIFYNDKNLNFYKSENIKR